mmetsp:Transcript_58950/g.163138  ORF Transcript_58950/g.163138 Transcript_58950/m.163138 type:complete len:231 (-) Transcript_58950:230-922(-)
MHARRPASGKQAEPPHPQRGLVGLSPGPQPCHLHALLARPLLAVEAGDDSLVSGAVELGASLDEVDAWEGLEHVPDLQRLVPHEPEGLHPGREGDGPDPPGAGAGDLHHLVVAAPPEPRHRALSVRALDAEEVLPPGQRLHQVPESQHLALQEAEALPRGGLAGLPAGPRPGHLDALGALLPEDTAHRPLVARPVDVHALVEEARPGHGLDAVADLDGPGTACERGPRAL